MGIIDTLQRIIRPNTPDAVKAGAFQPLSYGQAWLRGMDFYNRYAFKFPDAPEGWTKAVRSNVWAFNCVNARANAFSAVPLKLYKKSGKPEVEDTLIEEHPILSLLEDVNTTYLDRASFRHACQWQRAEQGQAYIRKIRGGDGKPVELYVLPAHLVEPEPDPMRLVSFYKYGGYPIAREDVIRWYYTDSSNPIEAMSPTSVAVRAINRYNIADIAAQAIDEHGGRGGGIISAEINLLDPDMRRLVEEWNDMTRDPARAGETRMLPHGTTYANDVLTAQQMQREERAGRLAKEIMAAYGVPPSLAGDYSDASVLANAAQQDSNFWRSVMLYELQSFADNLTYFLLWQDWPEAKEAGLYLAHDTEEVAALQDDELKTGEVARGDADRATVLMAGGVISLNEAREIVGMEPIADDERADQVLPDMSEMEDPDADPEADMMDDGEDMANEDLTDPEDDELDAEIADILGGDVAAKSDTPGQMGPRGGAAAGGSGKFDEGKVKRDGGKFAAKEGSGTDKPKRTRKKDPKKEAERKAKQAAKRVEKAKERIAKLDADEKKLRAALEQMQGKDDPSNLRKRISKALERVAKRREKMQGVIDRKGEKDNTPAASEADKLAAEVAGKADMLPVVHTGAMIALMLSDETQKELSAQLADFWAGLPDGSTPEVPDHITLAYLGQADNYSFDEKQRVNEAVARAADQVKFPARITLKGVGRFDNGAVWIGVAAEGLDGLRKAVVSECSTAGISLPNDHGDWRPHATIAYVEKGVQVAMPLIKPVQSTITSITAMWAGNRTDKRLGSSGGAYIAVSAKADDSFTPPDAVQRAAARGLKLRDEFGRGGTEIGVARARDLSNGRGISMDTIGRMVSYFARHEVDKQGEGWADESNPSAGYIAWLLWGGDPGRAWAERIYDANKPAAKATLMPIVDFVGMTATDLDGVTLGTVERIARQGQHDGWNATPSLPAVYVAGKAYRGDAVRVVMEV